MRRAIAAEGGEFRKSLAARKLSDEQLEEAVRLYRESDLPVQDIVERFEITRTSLQH